jgi:hypothetical protein
VLTERDRFGYCKGIAVAGGDGLMLMRVKVPELCSGHNRLGVRPSQMSSSAYEITIKVSLRAQQVYENHR